MRQTVLSWAIIILGLATIVCRAADDKPLTAEQKLKIRDAQLALSKAQSALIAKPEYLVFMNAQSALEQELRQDCAGHPTNLTSLLDTRPDISCVSPPSMPIPPPKSK